MKKQEVSTIVYKGIVIRRRRKEKDRIRCMPISPRHATVPTDRTILNACNCCVPACLPRSQQRSRGVQRLVFGWLMREHTDDSRRVERYFPSSHQRFFVFCLSSLPETGIHNHGVPLGAAEQILDVDVVEVLLRLHAVERRLRLLMRPAVWHSTHISLLLLLR